MSEQLDSLLATAADQGWKLRDPAPPERVEQLAEWFRLRTGGPLPAGYRDFLDRTDGLTVNGAEIYASADATTVKGVAISGLVETNERYDLDFGEESDPGAPTFLEAPTRTCSP